MHRASGKSLLARQDDQEIESGESADNEPLEGSPEALIRNDTWWINCLRVFLMGTLFVVAIGISSATYKLLANLESQEFCRGFDTVSTRITQAFLQEMKMKLWLSSFATLAISKKAALGEDYLDANRNFFDKLTTGVGDLTYWSRIGFSPLLWTESERRGWEAYARSKTETQVSERNICNICGEGMAVGNPNNLVSIPGYGDFPCYLADNAGLTGLIPKASCPQMPALVKVACHCKPGTTIDASGVANVNTTSSKIFGTIFRIKDGKRIKDIAPTPYCPVWEGWPQPPNDALLYNQMSDPSHRQAILSMIETKLPTLARTRYPDGEYQRVMDTAMNQPQLSIFYPVFDRNGTNSHSVVGLVAIDTNWISALGFADKIPPQSEGVTFVIENGHGQAFTFEISDGRAVSFVGEGDLHDPQFDEMMKGSTYEQMRGIITTLAPSPGTQVPETALVYKISVYPSEAFKAHFVTRKPVYYAVVVAFIFAFTSAIFLLYDVLVRRRQFKVMQSASQSNAIVSNMFPEFITSRLMINSNARQSTSENARRTSPSPFMTPKHQLRSLLGRSEAMEKHTFSDSEPIADFFPDVTVVFADIAGFTAWSSEREPVQVFQLLETVYQTFDKIALKHGVFKVETIGDCYVAVTGLPVPQADHAVRMARFAYEIMLHMHEMATSLESLLGPGTGSLSLRVGLHSGPVTGGVLRGERARFQLFGDTMNTAARMQTTGLVDTIQASETTAALLIEAGHLHWVETREEKVLVKGKGDMQTYWIDLACAPAETDSTKDGLVSENLPEIGVVRKGGKDDSFERLVNWNADVLEKFLKKVVASRWSTYRRQRRRGSTQLETGHCGWDKPIDDITEVIEMSTFCEKTADQQVEPESVELSETARVQLRAYVERIAAMYHDNAFHNFEHASHVAMSANKIIKRIIKPEGVDYHQESIKKRDRKKAVARQIHKSTFGISSDALMQFAVLFSALIHDVDHTGVSNAQLVQEGNVLAVKYNNKCVAEQNSIRIALDLLMESQFSDLRACIYTNDEEMSRFRQLVVNAVIATDIADGELQTLRKNRWYKAFYEANRDSNCHDDDISYKATVAFEYIIQASDVAHTMQHWHVYNKWNERLFEERYLAYLAGREQKDPSSGWYEGEIWFFDNYIIPLARKLETCGVFGVSSDEYLNYALANRHEWERRGREIVEQTKEKYMRKELNRFEAGIAA